MRIRTVIASLILFGVVSAVHFFGEILGIGTHSDRVQAAVGQGGASLYFPIVRVAGSYAIHRSGQTFISWPEDKTVQGERYRIYRSSQPITAATFASATLLGEVGKNSATFYANYYQYAGIWKLRYVDRYIIENGGSQISANWGLFVWTLNAQDFSGGDHGDGYYAITEIPPGGVEKFSIYMTFGPVSEALGTSDPVDITASIGNLIGAGGHVFIQYMDQRNWNSTFHAPNVTNRYWGKDPKDPNLAYDLQYAYDYDVFLPLPEYCGGALPAKLPIFLYLHGHKDNGKGGEGDYPNKYCAYGIYPFDDTDTWWFGFASQNDYRKGGNPQKGDIVVNYTEQRLLRMIADLERNPLGPPVDQQRIYVAGQSMGGTGSLALAERYPNVFAAAYASQPLTNFLTAGVSANGEDWAKDAAIKFGDAAFHLGVKISAPNGWAAPIQKYNGMGVYDWTSLPFQASSFRLADNTAIIGVTFGTNDQVVYYNSQGKPTIWSLNDGKRPWAGMVNAAPHLWQYFDGLPPAASKRTILPNGLPFWGLTVVKDETVPGLSNLSGNKLDTNSGVWNYNQTIKWSSSWDPWDKAPIDQDKLWQMSFCSLALESWSCGSGADQKVDVTLRRLQHFVVTPGVAYQWVNTVIATGRNTSGVVTADKTSTLTIPGVSVSANGNRLTVTPK
jgi:pimeloyl-ACP methyl ester carboxylesterase